MRLFVAFHYTAEDKWIREYVIPLLETFDVTVVTGENIHGEIIVQEVRELIGNCDAMIAFVTRQWASHPWVRDELVTALAIKIPALEVRDQTLVNLGGGTDGRQNLLFDKTQKEALLVGLARIVAKWKKRFETRSLLILPDEVMSEARPHLRNKQLKCIYQFKDGNEESQQYEAAPFRLPKALAVDIKHIPSPNALVQLFLEGPGFSYSSGYQPFSLIPINLQKD